MDCNKWRYFNGDMFPIYKCKYVLWHVFLGYLFFHILILVKKKKRTLVFKALVTYNEKMFFTCCIATLLTSCFDFC